MDADENVEVFYTIPVEKKVMIRESHIKDWDDDEELKEFIAENYEQGDSGEIEITSIG